ncbi:hypothetical protein [Kitasatospora sp. NPDC098663]|uniref:hypothetical protein n=1 Tax=Kitasatospora sp. NPDC098663 TaxID=3364096 RepID=UPI0038170096
MTDDLSTPDPAEARPDEPLAPGRWGVRIVTDAGTFLLSHTTVEPQARVHLIGNAIANSRLEPDGEVLSVALRRRHRVRWHRLVRAVLAACQAEVFQQPAEHAQEVQAEHARLFREWVLEVLDRPDAPKPAGVVDYGPADVVEPCRWGIRVDTGAEVLMLSTVTRSPIPVAELISTLMANTTGDAPEHDLAVVAKDAGISWETGRTLLLTRCDVQLVRYPPAASAARQAQQRQAFHRWAQQLLLQHTSEQGTENDPASSRAATAILEATVDGKILKFTALQPLELPPERLLEKAVSRDLAWEGQNVAQVCAAWSVPVPDIVRYAEARFGLRVARPATWPVPQERRIDPVLAQANRQRLAKALIEALGCWNRERAVLDEPRTAPCRQHPKGSDCSRCERLRVREDRWIEQVVEGLATGYAPNSLIRTVPEQFNGVPTMWWVAGYTGSNGARQSLLFPARTIHPGRALLGFLRDSEMGQIAAARRIPQLAVLQALERRLQLRVDQGPLSASAAAATGLSAERRRKGKRWIRHVVRTQLPKRLPVDLETLSRGEFGLEGVVCLRKAVYVSQDDALRHRWIRRAPGRRPAAALDPYQCPVCALWHLTSRDD